MSELWDVYDENRNKTGRIVERGTCLTKGDYHLVVIGWIKNSKNQYLISKRYENKIGGNLWDAIGGCVSTGETSEDAIVREVFEEVGIKLDKRDAQLVESFKQDDDNIGWFGDYWYFQADINIEEVVCQENEISEVKWATRNEILELISKNEFFKGVIHLKYLFSKKLL